MHSMPYSDKSPLNIFLPLCRNVQIFLGSRWDHAMLILTASNPLYFRTDDQAIWHWHFLTNTFERIKVVGVRRKAASTKSRFDSIKPLKYLRIEHRRVCKLMLNNVYKFTKKMRNEVIFRASFSRLPLTLLSADFIVLMKRVKVMTSWW